MEFEINVALFGKHFFATRRAQMTEQQAITIAREIAAKFTLKEGYEVTLSRWDTRGSYVAIN